MLLRSLMRYYGIGYAYCVARKTILIRDAKVVERVKVIDLDTNKMKSTEMTLPMLKTEKAAIILLASAWNTTVWPLYLLFDLSDFEMWLNRYEDPRWDSKPKPSDTYGWIVR